MSLSWSVWSSSRACRLHNLVWYLWARSVIFLEISSYHYLSLYPLLTWTASIDRPPRSCWGRPHKDCWPSSRRPRQRQPAELVLAIISHGTYHLILKFDVFLNLLSKVRYRPSQIAQALCRLVVEYQCFVERARSLSTLITELITRHPGGQKKSKCQNSTERATGHLLRMKFTVIQCDSAVTWNL